MEIRSCPLPTVKGHGACHLPLKGKAAGLLNPKPGYSAAVKALWGKIVNSLLGGKISPILKIITLGFVCTLLSCREGGEQGAVLFSVEDAYGEALSFEAYPQRVVSLTPSLSESVFALGRGERLVGRTDYCDYPPEIGQLPSVGTLLDPSVEQIVSLKPDLVLASSHVRGEVLETLTLVGIPVLALYKEEDFEGVYTLLETLGLVLDAQTEAQTLIGGMKASIAETVDIVSQARERPRVYYVVDYGEYGDFTAGGNTFIHAMLTMAGGENIAKDLKGWAYSLEKIVEANPDLLILSRYGGMKRGILQSPNYQSLRAVQEGRVYEVDSNQIVRQGPRLAQGLRELAEVIHPELFGTRSE